MPLAAGTRLGSYEVVSAIGAGGMGEVYRARDTRLDRTVAVKVLPPQLAGDPEFRERFDREGRAISQLNHPNICTLYDVGEAAVDITAYVTTNRGDAVGRPFDISPDGTRFLMLKPLSTTTASIAVVSHWFDEVRAKMAAAR
jgi:serine/threonine protein kinase